MGDPAGALQFKDLITEAGLGDRGWIKDFAEKPVDKDTVLSVLKKLDGAETLIGRKIGIPADDAKPEETDKFYAALGLKKPEDYEVPAGEGADQEFIKVFREALFEGKLSKTQTGKFLAKVMPALKAADVKRAEAAAKFKAEQEKSDAEFDALVKQAHGENGAKAIERAKKLLEAHVPEAFKPHVGRLDNNSLAILSSVLNAVWEKYGKEDDLGGGNGGGAGGADVEALREEARKLQSSPEWRDPSNPGHKKVAARVAEIYAHPAFKA